MAKRKLTWTQTKRKLLKQIDTEFVTNEYQITYPIFKNIPEEGKLKPKHVLSRCWLVDDTRTSKVYVKKVTDGYVKIQVRGEIIWRTKYPEEVMLHPIEWEPLNGETDPPSKKRKKKVTKKKSTTKKTTTGKKKTAKKGTTVKKKTTTGKKRGRPKKSK